MHPSTIWREVARFRRVTGQHPDEFKIPGMRVDPTAYWAAQRPKVKRWPSLPTASITWL